LFRHAKGVQGLYQFKKCFDPYWRSEHLVANGVWAGILGTLDLVRLINSQGTDANTTHNHYGFYEFASNHPLCYALKRMTRKGPQQ
ncbi:MAG: hypothetical protein OXD48_12595, partial [Litoreibacter sp.]|nr:hypothetical protein [Litoreibacter sp.]